MKITSLEVLQKYTNVSNGFKYSKLEPFEQTSITKYLLRWFNEALLDQVFGFSTEAVGTTKRKAYEALMQAHCSFTMLEYSTEGEIIVSDLGFIRTENETSKTAYAGQIKKWSEAMEDNGYMYVGRLIEIMTTDTTQPTIFTEWVNSDGYANRATLLVKSAKEFNNIQRLYRMHTTFIEIATNITECQDLYLRAIFGNTLVNELITNANGMNADKVIARGYLIAAVVYITMALSLQKGLVKLTPSGVMVIGHDSNTSRKIETPAMPEHTSSSYQSYLDTGMKYVDRAKKHLITAGIIVEETATRTRFIG